MLNSALLDYKIYTSSYMLQIDWLVFLNKTISNNKKRGLLIYERRTISIDMTSPRNKRCFDIQYAIWL